MLRRSPLKPKREKPRRNEGRVTHGRMKEKASRDPNTEERAFHKLVRSVGCLVCGRPATIHHVTSDGHKRIARSHERVTPLCPQHHQKVFDPKDADPISVEGLTHAGFTARYGVDLLKWATDAWERRETPEHPFWSDGVTRLREVARGSELKHKAAGERERTNKRAQPGLSSASEER